MTITRLSPAAGPAGPPPNAEREFESRGARVRYLQNEARRLAADQVEALATALAEIADQAAEIATGGEAYPVGVREMASRLASDLPDRAQAIRALQDRTVRRQ